jgi:hypothetical protein
MDNLPVILSPDGFDRDEVLVSGFPGSATKADRQDAVETLQAKCESKDKESLIVNSTRRGDEAVLKELGFDIVEEYGENGLTTGIYQPE